MFIPGMFICWGDACGFGDAEGICIPGIFISIFGDAPGDGVGIGMFISIFCCGDPWAFGDAAGIFMPGIFICVGGDACGLGVAVFCGEVALGIFMPGIFIPGLLLIVCLCAARRLVVVLRRVLLLFRFASALGFDIFMAGMFCMFWPRVVVLLADENIRPITMTALRPIILTKASKPNFFMIPPVELPATNKATTSRTKAHVRPKVSDDS